MHKHASIIKMLVQKHLPELHEHFEEHSVTPECYASDWIFSLFCSVLPENETKITASFFTKFLKYKWEFFYKLCLTVLNHIKERILRHDNQLDVLLEVKIAMSNKNDALNYAN